MELLKDRFGRIASNLRISVTDRCNLACFYCSPLENRNNFPVEDILTLDEIRKLVRIFSDLGVDTIRLTGGEPLLRKGICDFIKELKTKCDIKRIRMTSNGVLLGKFYEELKKSGLDSINISLDTLNQKKFQKITGYDKFSSVLDNILRIHKETPIKVRLNCVLLKNNVSEIDNFVNFADKHDLTIRFIEFMPFKGNSWLPTTFVSSNEIISYLQENNTLIPELLEHISQTSRMYKIKNKSGKIGFISSVSQTFCQWCNRIRITSDGMFRTCLHAPEEFSLRNLLRNHANNEDIKEKIIDFVNNKNEKHKDFLNEKDQLPVFNREMIKIGG